TSSSLSSGQSHLRDCRSTSTSLDNTSLLRLGIFLFPSAAGMVATILIDQHLIDPYIGVLCASVTGFLFTIAIHWLSRIDPPPPSLGHYSFRTHKTSPLFPDGSDTGSATTTRTCSCSSGRSD